MKYFFIIFAVFASLKNSFSQETELNLLVWANIIPPEVIKQFEEEQKHTENPIKINMMYFDSDEMLEARLYAGNTGFDVIMTSANPYLINHIKADFYQKIDHKKLKNYHKLSPVFLKRLAEFDPHNQYSLPFSWGTAGIGYNVTKIKEIMPDAPVNSWAMFLDPTIISKFQKCGVSILDVPTEVIPITLGYYQRNPLSHKNDDLNFAFEKLHTIRPYIKRINTGNYMDLLANGDICLALGWSADILNAQYHGKKKGQTIEYQFGKEVTPLHIDILAIPKESKKADQAHAFFDFILRADINIKITQHTLYGNAHKGAIKSLPIEFTKNPIFFPGKEEILKYVMDKPPHIRYKQKRIRYWENFKQLTRS